jgi:hypothetical protein
LRLRSLGAFAATILASAAACALSMSCALVSDLNSDQFHLADAASAQCGADGAADASCPLVFSVGSCEGNCLDTQVCCVSLGAMSGVVGLCMDPTACSNQTTSAALCRLGTPCANGAMCVAQTCGSTGSSATVYACTLLDTCKAL